MSASQAYAETPEKDKFSNSILLSLSLHFFVLAFFMIKAVFFPEDMESHMDSIRVDMVALPEKVIEQIKANPPPLPPEPAKEKSEKPPEPIVKVKPIQDPEAINLNANKKKQSAALDKLKELSALEKISQEENTDKKAKALSKLQTLKGQELNAGTELRGVAKLQHEEYLNTIERHIRSFWSLPEWLKNKNLTAQVQVTFDENGQILSKKIVKSSGNASFDERVLQTVTQSAPVPAPPKSLSRIISSEGILIGFPE